MLSNYGVILAAYVISLIKIDILISDLFFVNFHSIVV